MALCALERYWWGEGEMKFFLDGDEVPRSHLDGSRGLLRRCLGLLDRPPLPGRSASTLFAGYPYRSTRATPRDRFSAGKPDESDNRD